MATDRRNIPEPRRTIFRGCQHHSAVGTELRGINPTFVGHRLAAICWFLSIIILRKRAPDCERLVTVSPVASAAATNRSNTGPEFPGRSLTDISRNRFGGNGRTIRRRRPSLSASSSAIKSAPHAAEQTSVSACSVERNVAILSRNGIRLREGPDLADDCTAQRDHRFALADLE